MAAESRRRAAAHGTVTTHTGVTAKLEARFYVTQASWLSSKLGSARRLEPKLNMVVRVRVRANSRHSSWDRASAVRQAACNAKMCSHLLVLWRRYSTAAILCFTALLQAVHPRQLCQQGCCDVSGVVLT